MTTTASTQARPFAGTGLLLRAAAAGVGVVVVVALLGLLAHGPDAAGGAALGGGVTLVVLLAGSLLVNAVAGLLPGMSLLVALMTYVLQLLVLALFLGLVRGSGALDSGALAPGWLAAGVVALTATWMLVQLVLSTRARIPVYDLPEPAADPRRGAAAGAEPGAR